MKALLLPILFISLASTAQTTHNVAVSSFSFTPSSLTIQVGDEVTWTNISGSHNVNGTQATFSSNPASFGNSVGAGWTYSFTFNIAGTYQYRCDPHSSQMQGTITVQSSVGVEEQTIEIVSRLFLDAPNSLLQLYFSTPATGNIQVFNLSGQLVTEQKCSNASEVAMHLDGLANAQYILRVVAADKEQSFPIILAR